MALNLGFTEALFARVVAAYPKPKPGTAGPRGFEGAAFARFLGVSASDVCRWIAGEREAGAYLPAQLCAFLVKEFGDADKAVRVVFGADLAAVGYHAQPRPDAEAAVHEAAVEVTEQMGTTLAALGRAMSPRSEGGVEVVAAEVPELIPSARALHAALSDLLATAPDVQEPIPFGRRVRA